MIKSPPTCDEYLVCSGDVVANEFAGSVPLAWVCIAENAVMASSNFLPSRESELVTWSQNFRTRIVAAPLPVGLSVPQATAYAALDDSFSTAYLAYKNEGGNSTANKISKDTAKRLLIANARLLAGIIQKFPGTTDTQRAELGLTVKDVDPSPVPVPASAPGIVILSVSDTTVSLRLIDPAHPSRRGKAAGIAGASLFSYVGVTPPASLSDWTFEGNTTRTRVDIAFPDATPAGSRVWLCAFWFNPRAQAGPKSAFVPTNLPGETAIAA